MEYPTGLPRHKLDRPFAGTQPESVTVHEADIIWYGIVATNGSSTRAR